MIEILFGLAVLIVAVLSFICIIGAVGAAINAHYALHPNRDTDDREGREK